MRVSSRSIPRRRTPRRRRFSGGRLFLLALLLALGWLLVRPGFEPFQPDTIILHHSASPPFVNGRPVDAAAIDAMHARRGFGTVYQGVVYHIGYHYVILPDGTVQRGRPVGCVGAHARFHNRHAIGICVVGDFSTASNPAGERGAVRPTPAQMEAVERLCGELMHRYRIPPGRVLRHADVGDTLCPGDRFPFQALQQSLRRGTRKPPFLPHER
ncbi:MAG: peptidoglycan recognition family protein [Armatimonadota bacterium]|nr:peptidoglycan recognition family protein [Armatimonadota bacterium]